MDISNLWLLIYENLREIEEIVDDRVDIDNNGGPNEFMRIKTELDNLKENLDRIKKIEEQRKRIDNLLQPQTPTTY